MKTALLVIDAQESFRHRSYFTPDGLDAYLACQQRLVDGALAKNVPVVQILHCEPEGPFSLASGHVRTMPPLSYMPRISFQKARHSAFVGTGLEIWLRQAGIARLMISGIRTEQCCETTTRHASDIGFAVDFITEATHTFPMVHADGTAFSADAIKQRSELVLADRFARIATIDEALKSAE